MQITICIPNQNMLHSTLHMSEYLSVLPSSIYKSHGGAQDGNLNTTTKASSTRCAAAGCGKKAGSGGRSMCTFTQSLVFYSHRRESDDLCRSTFRAKDDCR
jgi:hypothetical protein